MTTSSPRLGYLETISQVLALKTESLETEHETILQVLRNIDEKGFKVLAPYLFTTTSTEEHYIAVPLEATKEGYQQLKDCLEQEED